jgi:glutathione peroxidase
MKRQLIFTGILIFMAATTIIAQKNFHDFTVKDISGESFDLAQFKGQKVLVVNTASKCGLTPQYEDLEKLYKEYKDQGLVIIGFPANNFARQEPGTDEEIASFCQVNYGVTFPMMSKISVKGKDQHKLYTWLTSEKENGLEDSKVSWNFQKYMIDEEGNLVGHVSPKTKPFDEKIIAWITGT